LIFFIFYFLGIGAGDVLQRITIWTLMPWRWICLIAYSSICLLRIWWNAVILFSFKAKYVFASFPRQNFGVLEPDHRETGWAIELACV
jgi:hypothetical protein